jgi:3-deoxy-D-manno-octulosonic-acid transferase
MKFDSIDQAVFKKDYTHLRGKLNLKPQDKLLLAGSTHSGEEELVLGVYGKLLSDHGNLKLLIAPRHPQRSRVIEKQVSRLGFTPLSLSRLCAKDNVTPANKNIFILDTIGELLCYYSIADIVFMGGSLVKIGGHNLLEPAGFAKPILFGPYMFNFRDISRSFLNNQAAIMVEDAQQLSQQVRNLLNDPSLAKSIGNKAQQLILKNQGTSLRNVKWIKSIFSGT